LTTAPAVTVAIEAHHIDPKLHRVLAEQIPRTGQIKDVEAFKAGATCLYGQNGRSVVSSADKSTASWGNMHVHMGKTLAGALIEYTGKLRLAAPDAHSLESEEYRRLMRGLNRHTNGLALSKGDYFLL